LEDKDKSEKTSQKVEHEGRYLRKEEREERERERERIHI
jgi:hypothetical protein